LAPQLHRKIEKIKHWYQAAALLCAKSSHYCNFLEVLGHKSNDFWNKKSPKLIKFFFKIARFLLCMVQVGSPEIHKNI
jgi:hypothetical protein